MDLILPGLQAGGIAFGVCLVLVALARVLWRGETRALWSVPIGLAVAYALGHAWFRSWLRGTTPAFPPPDAYDWLAPVALVAGLLGFLESLAPTPAWARWENRAILSGGLVWLMLAPLLGNVWQGTEAAAWLVGLAAAVTLIWAITDAQATRLGRSVLFPLVVWVFAIVVCMQLCHSAVLAQLALALLGATTALWVVSWWSKGLTPARGGVPVIVLLVSGFLLFARFYGYPELPAPTAIGLALAPAALWIDALPPAAKLGPIWRAVLRFAAFLLPLGVAVGFAIHEFLKSGLEGYY